MSFEAIESITAAELGAKKCIADAQAKAKQMLAEAEAAGKESIRSAKQKAELEIVELKRRSEAVADADVSGLRAENENKMAALKAKAEGRLEKAAALVAERIVNG